MPKASDNPNGVRYLLGDSVSLSQDIFAKLNTNDALPLFNTEVVKLGIDSLNFDRLQTTNTMQNSISLKT